MKVFVFGAGKVGVGLSRAMRAKGISVTLRAKRNGLPSKRIDATGPRCKNTTTRKGGAKAAGPRVREMLGFMTC